MAGRPDPRVAGLSLLVLAVAGCGGGAVATSTSRSHGVTPGASGPPSGSAATASSAAAVATPPRTGGSSRRPPAPAQAGAPAPSLATGGVLRARTGGDGAFTITGGDCSVSGDRASFHFGVPGSGEEARIDVSSGYRGGSTYGPGTFGVSASVLHAGRLWIVDFHSSSDATLTVDPGGRTGSVSYTSQGPQADTLSATFDCG